MAIRFSNGFGIGASNNGGGGGGGPITNCSPSSTFNGSLNYDSGTSLTWSDDTTGYSLYTGGFSNNDDGYSNNPITLPSHFYLSCTGSTKLYFSTNGFATLEVQSNNWGNNGPQGANPPMFAANVGDLFIDTGANLDDGTTAGLYYKITNNSNFMKVEIKVFESRFQGQSTPESYQLNLYRDSTYQWMEVLRKDVASIWNYNTYSAKIGPTSSSDVSQVPSTTSSQIWRGDLAGNSWEYMGEGSVIGGTPVPTLTPTLTVTPTLTPSFIPLFQYTPNGTTGSNGLLTYLNYTNGVDSGNNVLLPDSSGFNHPYAWSGNNPYSGGTTGYTFDTNTWAYASDASNYNLGFSSLTIEMWVKLPTVPSTISLLAAGGNNSGGWALRIDSSGNQLNLVKYNIADQTVNLPYTLQADTWYHIVAAQGGTSLTYFVNGEIVGAVNTGASNNFSFPNGTVNISKDYYTSEKHEMSLGILRVYDYCRLTTDVLSDFNNTKVGYGYQPSPSPSLSPSPTPMLSPTLTPTPTPTTALTGFTVTVQEIGSDVLMSASGTLDITGLTLVTSNAGPMGGSGIGVSTGTFICGANGGYFDQYSGFTVNATSFGSGMGMASSLSSGDLFGVIISGTPPYMLMVPTGYTSGTFIFGSQTFTGQSFSSLGLSTGTYVYSWSNGSINVVIA